MVRLSPQRFEELVGDALDGLPADLGAAMENVAVTVDDESPVGELLGLYEGVPLTDRGIDYSFVMPDRITIFMRTVCHACDSERDVVTMVRETVVHEVAHHFGIDDRRLDELGWS
ncbi:MAG TPA: metallopeptidase family protein [Acidimicrobiales bacterium]|nr:metallopeptidase family protein [Acidimicrobiales bacterium]